MNQRSFHADAAVLPIILIVHIRNIRYRNYLKAPCATDAQTPSCARCVCGSCRRRDAHQISKSGSTSTRTEPDRANIWPIPSLPSGLPDSAHVPAYILAEAFSDNGNFLKHQRRGCRRRRVQFVRPPVRQQEMAAMAAGSGKWRKKVTAARPRGGKGREDKREGGREGGGAPSP